MAIDDKVKARLVELLEQSKALAGYDSGDTSFQQDIAAYGQCTGWLASAHNLIDIIVPASGAAHRRLADVAMKRNEHPPAQVAGIAEILRMLLMDVDAGVLRGVADAARAEV